MKHFVTVLGLCLLAWFSERLLVSHFATHDAIALLLVKRDVLTAVLIGWLLALRLFLVLALPGWLLWLVVGAAERRVAALRSRATRPE